MNRPIDVDKAFTGSSKAQLRYLQELVVEQFDAYEHVISQANPDCASCTMLKNVCIDIIRYVTTTLAQSEQFAQQTRSTRRAFEEALRTAFPKGVSERESKRQSQSLDALSPDALVALTVDLAREAAEEQFQAGRNQALSELGVLEREVAALRQALAETQAALAKAEQELATRERERALQEQRADDLHARTPQIPPGLFSALLNGRVDLVAFLQQAAGPDRDLHLGSGAQAIHITVGERRTQEQQGERPKAERKEKAKDSSRVGGARDGAAPGPAPVQAERDAEEQGGQLGTTVPVRSGPGEGGSIASGSREPPREQSPSVQAQDVPDQVEEPSRQGSEERHASRRDPQFKRSEHSKAGGKTLDTEVEALSTNHGSSKEQHPDPEPRVQKEERREGDGGQAPAPTSGGDGGGPVEAMRAQLAETMAAMSLFSLSRLQAAEPGLQVPVQKALMHMQEARLVEIVTTMDGDGLLFPTEAFARLVDEVSLEPTTTHRLWVSLGEAIRDVDERQILAEALCPFLEKDWDLMLVVRKPRHGDCWLTLSTSWERPRTGLLGVLLGDPPYQVPRYPPRCSALWVVGTEERLAELPDPKPGPDVWYGPPRRSRSEDVWRAVHGAPKAPLR